MSTHSIHSSFSGGMAFKTNINGHEVLTDTTEDDGGSNSGPSPKRLMLTALSGCTGIDIVSILTKMKVSFSDFSIDIDAHLSKDHPKIYEHVQLTYSIRLAEGDHAKMKKAVKLSQEKYCGVYAMFNEFAKVETTIRFL